MHFDGGTKIILRRGQGEVGNTVGDQKPCCESSYSLPTTLPLMPPPPPPPPSPPPLSQQRQYQTTRNALNTLRSKPHGSPTTRSHADATHTHPHNTQAAQHLDPHPRRTRKATTRPRAVSPPRRSRATYLPSNAEPRYRGGPSPPKLERTETNSSRSSRVHRMQDCQDEASHARRTRQVFMQKTAVENTPPSPPVPSLHTTYNTKTP